VLSTTKSSILPFDDLVTIVTNFCSADEDEGPVTDIYAYVEHRPPAYRGSDTRTEICC